MNNQSPLIPQGSLLEQKNKGRARVRIAVFVVLAIHGIGLLALLMQGCKKEPEVTGTTADQTPTNMAPAFVEPTNAVPLEAATNVSALPTNPPPALDTLPPTTLPTAPAGVATDYKVQQGDTFSSIAQKFHVSTKAISAANPGVVPTRLKIDQVLHIPAPTAPVTNGTTTTAAAVPGGAQVYSVKSGDTLTKIASQFGVSLRALRAANSLTTDRIKVGQKLTIPAKAPAPVVPAPSSGTSAPAGTAPAGQ